MADEPTIDFCLVCGLRIPAGFVGHVCSGPATHYPDPMEYAQVDPDSQDTHEAELARLEAANEYYRTHWQRKPLPVCLEDSHSFSWRQGIEPCRYCGEPVAADYEALGYPETAVGVDDLGTLVSALVLSISAAGGKRGNDLLELLGTDYG